MYLVTGSAGFIGMQVAATLLKRGENVVGIDSYNDYYDQNLKKLRTDQLNQFKNFSFLQGDIADQNFLTSAFNEGDFKRVINLAGQPGVRYSIEHPEVYIHSNLVGFANILECCKRFQVEHLVYASSSSVYGMNSKIPFSVDDPVDRPLSLYAATKKSNELMAHSYSHIYGLRTTGLRYFTVYGPWGRPDMAVWKFTDAIGHDREIEVYNNGDMQRDFTYIDDIVDATILITDSKGLKFGRGLYNIYNIGASSPTKLMDLISLLEQNLMKKAKINYLPLEPTDPIGTYADISPLKLEFGYMPRASLAEGIEEWVKWYRGYIER